MVGARPSALLLLASVVFLGGWAAPDTLRLEVERVAHQPEARVGGVRIASRTLLPALYQERAFEPAWSDPGRRTELVVAIRGADSYGLDPAEYHLAAIERQQALLAAGAAPELESQLDVILTDALIRLLYHLEFGRVDPRKLDGNWTLVREIDEERPLRVLLGVFEAEDLGEAIASFGPQDPIYTRLRQALARYRAIQGAGGWPRVPEGPKLELGSSGERFRTLRKRLEITGELREYDLQSGQAMQIDPGHIAMFEPTVKYDLERVKGVKNIIFGGEGLFLATLLFVTVVRMR